LQIAWIVVRYSRNEAEEKDEENDKRVEEVAE
jgi:hypothetical protein